MTDRQFMAEIRRLLGAAEERVQHLQEALEGRRAAKRVHVRAYSVRAYKVNAHDRVIVSRR